MFVIYHALFRLTGKFSNYFRISFQKNNNNNANIIEMKIQFLIIVNKDEQKKIVILQLIFFLVQAIFIQIFLI